MEQQNCRQKYEGRKDGRIYYKFLPIPSQV